jgi:hypothetical protein
MQNRRIINGQLRAVALAIGGAIITSVIAMFIPVSVFENITGASGISELIPATAAPLGDTARAMIAFGMGLLAFFVIIALLFINAASPAAVRSTAPRVSAEVAEAGEAASPSFFESMREKIADFAEKRRSSDTVTELSDLPKLRAGDAHPDAPPRRPISAARDFADIETERAIPAGLDVASALSPQENAAEEPAARAIPVAPQSAFQSAPQSSPRPILLPNVPAFPTPPMASPEIDSSDVADMIDRLEAGVALRQESLNTFEAIVKAEAAKRRAPVEADLPAPPRLEPAPQSPQPSQRPVVLEAVPNEATAPASADHMDAALRSALETLHRMNVRTR